MSTVGSHTRQKVGERDGWNCHYCDKHFAKRSRHLGTVDHVVPRSAGGTNNAYNLVWSCRECNSDKSSMEYVTFCQKIGRRPSEEVLFRLKMLSAGMTRPARRYKTYRAPWAPDEVNF